MIFLLDKVLAYLVFPVIAAALTRRGTGARVLWYFGTVLVCMVSSLLPVMMVDGGKRTAELLSGRLELPELMMTVVFGIMMCVVSGATRGAMRPSVP